MKRPVIIAHRGAPEVVRENTLASIALARRLGAGMVEIDVRRTKDGVLLVHHEDRIAGMDEPIESLTWPAISVETRRCVRVTRPVMFVSIIWLH